MSRRWVRGLSGALIVAALSMGTAFADSSAAQAGSQQAPSGEQQMDAKRTEMKQKWEQMQAKWNTLSAAQKEQVYALHSQMAKLQKQLADQYLSLGLIDQATAAEMKSAVDKMKQQLKDGRMPMMGFKCGKHGAPKTSSEQ